MTSQVFALVLLHDQPELLERCLQALKLQTVKPIRTVVVDTSKSTSLNLSDLEVIKLPANTGFAEAVSKGVESFGNQGFVWLLHDDSIPFADSLEKLLKEIELSPSIAQVGPKQLELDNPKVISQMGLTITRSFGLLSKVKDEFDQGQHDRIEDVLAVGTAGTLISLNVFEKLEGFNPKAPKLAADVDFSLRVRLSGSRVTVAPESKLSHAMLSLKGKRPLSWLGAPVSVALRRAELHLLLSYSNPIAFILLWLGLLPISLLHSFLLAVTKRARKVPIELTAALATFLSLPAIISSRSLIARTTSQSFGTLRGLFATKNEIKLAKRRAREREISEQLIAAHARGDEQALAANTSILATGAIWWALAVAALNIFWLPTNIAVSSTNLVPLGDDWLEVFSAAGSSGVSYGLAGNFLADPFNWVLALISAPFFFAPSLSITLLVFFATAIAFLGMFRLSLWVSSKPFARITLALLYAFWPSLTLVISETLITQVIAIATLPWLVSSLAEVFGFGKAKTSSPWGQVGIAGILFAIVAASAPSLGIALFVAGLVLCLIWPKRILAFALVPGLTLAWYLPIAISRISSGNLLSLIADPAVPTFLEQSGNWSLLLFGYSFGDFSPELLLLVAAGFVLLAALAAFLTPDLAKKAVLWPIGLIGLAVSVLVAGISFDFGDGAVGVMPFAAMSLFGLVLVLLAGYLLDSPSRIGPIVAAILVLFSVLPSAGYLLLSPPKVTYTDGRIVPSIIQAEANAGSTLKTLELENQSGLIAVSVFAGDGIKLHEFSTESRITGSKLIAEDPKYQRLGQLVANLVSANGISLQEEFQALEIGYVLVNPKNRELEMALNSSAELESIGDTDFGQLWKVSEVKNQDSKSGAPDYLPQLIQTSVLIFYVLLALPTGNLRRRRGTTSEIFVDVEESN